MELHERVCLYVIKVGFYDISQLRYINLDHSLIAVLAE
jgi:hypothetical protein